MSTGPNHLAIETSGRTGSVALLCDAEVVDQITLPAEPRITQSLAPALQKLINRMDQGLASLRWISVAVGPGSFTGLRVGVTTAKSLAYASGAALLGVDCLEILAHQALHHPDTRYLRNSVNIATAIKAYRGQVYCAAWHVSGEGGKGWEILEPEQALPQAEWFTRVKELSKTGETTILTGDGFAGSNAQFEDQLGGASYRFSRAECWVPTAAAGGLLAWPRFARGERDDFWKMEPRYLRPSAAEENSP